VTIGLKRVGEDDVDQLVEFLVGNSFPFHVADALDRETARARVEDGRYWGETTLGYWILDDEDVVGLAQVDDLDDDTPLFDLRIADEFRGHGLGREALRLLTAEVFASLPDVHRFEGQTRVDNLAMRHVLLRCGFVKEAHYREAWPSSDGRLFDSVGYAILRRDWELGLSTAVDWDDLV
jgi:RimJ/RimL family protein N-acetyltransferase